jgi:hypothetical protein
MGILEGSDREPPKTIEVTGKDSKKEVAIPSMTRGLLKISSY